MRTTFIDWTKRMLLHVLVYALAFELLASIGTVQANNTQMDAPSADAAEPALQDADSGITLTPLGTYATGVFDGGASEIVAFDPATQRAFSVNATDAAIDVIDISDPAAPTLLSQIDVTPYGAMANSVDVHDGVLVAAVENDDKQANGSAVFFNTDGEFIASVEVGALPDMITFSPDGSEVLTANEGEPNADYDVDPEGSVSIIDVSGGVENLTQANVTTAGFAAFNDLDLGDSVRIFGPNATAAQDFEPEYVALSADSSMAWVTLQENNALAVIDIQAGEVITVTGLGFKDWNRAQAKLDAIEFTDLPVLATTAAGQDILMGGFSGLYFEGVDAATGNLKFITHPDRGPNPDPVDVDDDGVDERPFALPEYQAQWLRFEVNPETHEISWGEQTLLTTADGAPISGLPNLAGEGGAAYADEEPIDLFGNALELDPYGADMEGIVQADDGTWWMVDEYRPAIYHFDADGRLISRYVPEGSNENEAGTEVGVEAIPAIYAQRRANRGFEAVAYADGIVYAFIQSPIDDPDTERDTNSRNGKSVRILAFDTATESTVAEYVYMIEGGAVDKIGDAVALSSTEMLVIERDSAFGPEAQKYIFKIDLSNATNIHDIDVPQGLQLQSAAGLAAAGIHPVQKTLYVDLAAIGYHMGDKPEGLAFVDENTLAVLNDNDFGISATFSTTTGLLDEPANVTPVVLGLISLTPIGLDASDRDDAINIQNWPIYGMYQPDAIAAYEVDGETYLVTANEGDARDYDGYSEEARVGDLVLDLSVFPNAAQLQKPENLGRLNSTTAGTDTNGDGLVDRILTYGARSFSIWNASGQLVWDSGSQIAEIVAATYPDDFNSNSENGTFDNRSDDKGAEPEGVEIGVIDGKTYAFIGLERMGGVMVYDISTPTAPVFIDYVNNRDFSGDAEAGAAGDLAPEGLKFVPAADSPTGGPLLLVANELSGSMTVYAIE
ncbi:MAG: choice-of-anchor I family protein [Caldilineaceae bacterium]